MTGRFSAFQQWTDSRGFAYLALVCALVAAFLWEASASFGWLPLAIGLLPWGLRILTGRFPFRRTPLDLPLALFLASALIAVWAAYDRPAALWKLWLLLAAALIFYAIAGLEARDMWAVAKIWGFFAILIAAYDLLTHDWVANPAKIEAINQAGLSWMAVRPQVRGPNMHPNFVSGITAPILPFVLALAVRAWQQRRLPSGLLYSAASALILLVLLLSTTRGAWLALAGTAALLLWWVLSHRLARRIAWDGRVLFVLVLVVVMAPLAVFLLARQELLIALTGSLPGPSATESRLGLMIATADLAADVPFTGGGLYAFPGLYSTYIRVTPEYIWPHGHNVYLDVALEQGILGLMSLGWIALASLWWLLRSPDSGPEPVLRAAALASLLIMAIHGLVSDNIYHTAMTPFLLVVPGIAVVLEREYQRTAVKTPSHAELVLGRRRRVVAVAVAGLALVLLGLLFRNPLVSAWYANLGAVEMARVELAGWGSGARNEALTAADLEPAEGLFERALAHNPSNRTAHHRLGLIAMQRRDFPTAIRNLEAADRIDPGHWGISKALAFAYAWEGQYERAAPLMRWNPDIQDELADLALWWQDQGREDLAQHAEAMRAFLISSQDAPAASPSSS